MKDPKTYVSAAAAFERTADDGWPEDAGWWPERIGRRPLHTVDFDTPNQEEGRLSLSQFMKSVWKAFRDGMIAIPINSSDRVTKRRATLS